MTVFNLNPLPADIAHCVSGYRDGAGVKMDTIATISDSEAFDQCRAGLNRRRDDVGPAAINRGRVGGGGLDSEADISPTAQRQAAGDDQVLDVGARGDPNLVAITGQVDGLLDAAAGVSEGTSSAGAAFAHIIDNRVCAGNGDGADQKQHQNGGQTEAQGKRG